MIGGTIFERYEIQNLNFEVLHRVERMLGIRVCTQVAKTQVKLGPSILQLITYLISSKTLKFQSIK